jgi:hypothetical protein
LALKGSRNVPKYDPYNSIHYSVCLRHRIFRSIYPKNKRYDHEGSLVNLIGWSNHGMVPTTMVITHDSHGYHNHIVGTPDIIQVEKRIRPKKTLTALTL